MRYVYIIIQFGDYMDNLSFLKSQAIFLKKHSSQRERECLHNASFNYILPVYDSRYNPKLDIKTSCLIMIMSFFLISSVISLSNPNQSIKVLATTNGVQNSSMSPEESSSGNELSSSSQSAKQTDPLPDTNTCLPGQVEGPFENCTDPVCEPGQILSDHTCVNPTCPPGMEYNEDVGECLSDDFPPNNSCPDGSQGTIRQGPNGITLVECPLSPDTNTGPKSGIDRGDIDIKDGVLENSDTNTGPKSGIDRGNIDNNIGALN
mgnify:CR=1 FL=1